MDIEAIIDELEKIIRHHNRDYTDFSTNFISVRAVERDLMIIGEAISQIKKLDKDLPISSADQIIGLRNLIVHAYDSLPARVFRRITPLARARLPQDVLCGNKHDQSVTDLNRSGNLLPAQES